MADTLRGDKSPSLLPDTTPSSLRSGDFFVSQNMRVVVVLMKDIRYVLYQVYSVFSRRRLLSYQPAMRERYMVQYHNR